ncbi:hypothetical protein Pan258_48160 [Symmachiella dynata]|uniref:hypothetical protein n=1 Tax=Symmachiella dynata TaxID=2527995 RepID=UPI001189326F|nr:hypothetical protein [Symmachiella dynata]QDT50735.1 hypothetical protein Pan258_48160 [Symmachiella dynata]
MTAPQTETIEKFAFEGPITVTQAVLLAAVLAALFGWTIWREGRLTRRWLIPLFWVLRAAMLGVVLWMLLGPTHVTIKQHTTPRTIAIFADNSGSMEVVDAPRALEDWRWALGRRKSAALHPLQACDRARISAVAAEQHFRSATDALDRGVQDNSLGRAVAASHRCALRLQEYLATVKDVPASSRFTAIVQDQLKDIGVLIPELGTLSEELQSSPLVPQDGTAKMYAMLPRLERVTRGVERLSVMADQEGDAFFNSQSNIPLQSELAYSRRDKVMQLLNSAEETWLKELSESVRIRRYLLSDATNAVADAAWEIPEDPATAEANDDPAQRITNLTAGLEQLSRDAAGEDVAAALIFSDGRHNAVEGRPPRDVAAGLGKLPVHVVPLGMADMLRDVIVHHVDAPPAVAKDDLISIEAIVTTYKCEGETLDVELLHQDRVIDQQQITVSSDRADHRVLFSKVADEYGRHAFQLRVKPLVDETNNDNNYAAFEVETIEDSIRVLLADNLPRWEFRYLSNLFTRDKSLEYEQLLFAPEIAGTGRLQRLPEFPRKVEEWSYYRMVILGDVTPRQLDRDSQEALREYVTRQGGTLVIIAGQEAMPHAFQGEPLEELIPVEESSQIADRKNGFHLQLTAEGKMADALQIGEDAFSGDRIWQEMSHSLPVYSMSDYSHPKPTSHTLIRAVAASGTESGDSGRAFLCWQMVGRGRVVYLSAPTTYQLRIRNGDRYHHQFWGQLIRWAIARDLSTGSKTVRIQTDKSTYNTGEGVEAIVQLRNLNGAPFTGAQLEARAQQNGKVAASVPLTEDTAIPGRYTGRFDGLAVGSYAVAVTGSDVEELLRSEKAEGPIETPISIDPTLSMEMGDTRSNRPLLAQIAELTGGQVVPPTAVSEVLQTINLSPHVTEETSRQALWDSWFCFWVIFICLAAEWTIRKMTGLA